MSLTLIVDDDPQSLFLMRILLEQHGHTVHEADNGAEAVQATEKQAYDLVLMDVQMPVMDGLEATRRIKAAQNAPVVVLLTTKTMAGSVDLNACGCDGHIDKPLDINNFVVQAESYL